MLCDDSNAQGTSETGSAEFSSRAERRKNLNKMASKKARERQKQRSDFLTSENAKLMRQVRCLSLVAVCCTLGESHAFAFINCEWLMFCLYT